MENFDGDAGHDPRNHMGYIAGLQSIGLNRRDTVRVRWRV